MFFVPQQFPNISSLCVWFFFREVLQPHSDLRQFFLKKQEVLQTHSYSCTSGWGTQTCICALRMICFTRMLQQDVEAIENHIWSGTRAHQSTRQHLCVHKLYCCCLTEQLASQWQFEMLIILRDNPLWSSRLCSKIHLKIRRHARIDTRESEKYTNTHTNALFIPPLVISTSSHNTNTHRLYLQRLQCHQLRGENKAVRCSFNRSQKRKLHRCHNPNLQSLASSVYLKCETILALTGPQTTTARRVIVGCVSPANCIFFFISLEASCISESFSDFNSADETIRTHF